MAYEYTREEILAELERRQNAEQPQQPQKSNLQVAGDFFSGLSERLGQALGERKEDINAALRARSEGKISGPEMGLQILGKGVAGSALDVTGEAVGTAVGTLADVVNPRIREGFNDIRKGIMDSDVAKEAISLYQGLDENSRRNIESIFNITNALSPVRIKPRAGLGIGGAIEHGLKVVNKAKDMKRDTLRGLFQAPRTREAIDFELRHGTAQQEAMLNDLMDVKGVSPMYRPEKNLESLGKHMDGLENRIQSALTEFDKTGVMANAKSSFGKMLVDTVQNAPSVRELGLKTAKKQEVIGSIMRKVDGITKNMKETGVNPNSLSGLLQLRRRLDKVLRDSDFKKLSEGDIADIALEKHIVMQMRGKINDAISGFVEQSGKSNENIKELLRKQSSMYQAQDNLVRKTAMAEQDLTDKHWLMKAISSHPILVYNTMRHSGTSPALAFLMAAPSAINIAGTSIGATRRALSKPQVPVIRSGLFYGGQDTGE